MEPIESNRVRMLTIEWEMMDKNRFVGLSVINSLALRVVLYPLTVIKTRLQVFNYLLIIFILSKFFCLFKGSKARTGLQRY